MEYDSEIRVARQDDFYVDAAQCCALECIQQLLIRHEIGIGKIDVTFRAVDRRYQGYVNLAVGLIRRAANGMHDVPADRLQARKVMSAAQRLVVLLFPRGEE